MFCLFGFTLIVHLPSACLYFSQMDNSTIFQSQHSFLSWTAPCYYSNQLLEPALAGNWQTYFSSTRSFKLLQKQLDRQKSPRHLLEGTWSAVSSCTAGMCEQNESRHLLSLKQTARGKALCCFFHSFTHLQEWKLENLLWLTNQNF